ncbi:hypothetical protein HNR77_005066 [Paenibacillus sp. JGP012]|nr:hypothetical protein [Paenibacillus sp. JGP012]
MVRTVEMVAVVILEAVVKAHKMHSTASPSHPTMPIEDDNKPASNLKDAGFCLYSR